MAEHEVDAFSYAQVGKPVPAEDAFGGDDEPVTVRGNGLEEELVRV